MVSIIDRSRLGNLANLTEKKASLNNSKNAKSLTRYSKQREEEALRQAEENGYFLNITRSFITENFAPEFEVADADDDRSSVDKFLRGKAKYKDVNEVYLIDLTKSHIRNIGETGLCRNLTVCLMPNNFIANFDSLINCLCLTKLDLHGNQITSLPHSAFWASLVFLQFLHLHDNPLGDTNSIHDLAACENLVALTIYDTPLSLRRNYRHLVVNSIWSIKALDHHVISDEEIVEDANFRGRFMALSTNFQLDLCPDVEEGTTLEREMQTLRHLLRTIDRILAHNSPVLIIQRYFRGYRVRQKTPGLATTKHRKSRLKHNTMVDLHRQKSGSESYFPAIGEPVKVPSKVTDSTEEDTLRIDFDSYMSHARPGSSKQVTNRSDLEVYSATIPANIRIDPNKLQRLMNQLDQDSVDDIPALPKTAGDQRKSSAAKKQTEPKFKRIKDIKYMFGKMVSGVPLPDETPTGDFDDLPDISFRLRGLKMDPTFSDPMFEIIMARREAGHEVRLAESDYHRHSDLAPKPKIQKRKKLNNEQRFFTQTQGTMGLACLQAVQQAYKERDKAEKKAANINYVTELRQQRDQAKSRVKIYQEERRNAILRDRELERRCVADALEQKEFNQLEVTDKIQEKRSKLEQFTHQRRGELSFVSDFSAQITSVSKALMKESSKKKRENELSNRTDLITSHKMTAGESHSIVKKFLEHRKLMRQTESAITRAAMETKMVEDASNRLLEAKSRVASLRTRHDTIREFGFPAIHSPSPPVAKNRTDTTFANLVM